MGERGADGAAVGQQLGAVPRAGAAAPDQAAGPASGLEGRRLAHAHAPQVGARAVPAHPLRQEGDGGRRRGGGRARSRALRLPGGQPAAQVGHGDLRGGVGHLLPLQRHPARALARRHRAPALPLLAQALLALRRRAHAQQGGDGAPARRDPVQHGHGRAHQRRQPLDRHARDHDAAQDGLRVGRRAADEADHLVHVRDRRRVQDRRGGRDPRHVHQVPAEAPAAHDLPLQRAARGGWLPVQEGHRRHAAHHHRQGARGQGGGPLAPVRVHRGLRVHAALDADPPPAGRRGAEHARALQVHPLHLQPRRARERHGARLRRERARQVRHPARLPAPVDRRAAAALPVRQRRRGARPRHLLRRAAQVDGPAGRAGRARAQGARDGQAVRAAARPRGLLSRLHAGAERGALHPRRRDRRPRAHQEGAHGRRRRRQVGRGG
mmetsp:Transcript_27617/g.69952  ORF Transcript_27617/g.69952 Transcript_27617/m.69952 type:complete len:437 (+) Transcript_27617:681-1991(+)